MGKTKTNPHTPTSTWIMGFWILLSLMSFSAIAQPPQQLPQPNLPPGFYPRPQQVPAPVPAPIAPATPPANSPATTVPSPRPSGQPTVYGGLSLNNASLTEVIDL